MNMIRINLVDNTAGVKHIDFRVVPATNDKDFACVPAGILPLRSIMRLSRRVEAGCRFGELGEYLWYRLKETPPGKHKKPIVQPRFCKSGFPWGAGYWVFVER
jgi:hypothetical protein